MRARRWLILLAFAVCLACAPARTSLQTVAQAQSAPAQSVSATGWIDHVEEIEKYLKQAEPVRVVDIGTGVTNPKRAHLPPGGPVTSFVWKPVKPGIYRGYRESYAAEVAAYELDKLLGLKMVPVTVERRIAGESGSAKMWLEPAETFSDLGGLPTPPPTHISMWNLQMIRAKMFDNLIYNIDPNLGNWLVDPSWNIFLIDHSRALTPGKKLAHEMTRIDRDLWARMKQIDQATLTKALGAWLTKEEIGAIVERRDLMQEAIGKLVAAKGESEAFVRGATLGVETIRPSADTQTRNFARRAADAIEAPVFLPPASALMWIGQVVALADYKGTHAENARRGVERGHSLGLLTSDDLVYLTTDKQNADAYTRLTTLVGRQVEIFGPAIAVGPTVVVSVGQSSAVP